jgi:hypothetical protein
VIEDERATADRPDPNTRPCDACGHIWFAGERRHEYVGPAGASEHGDGEVLCVLCLRKQGLPRVYE